VISDIYPPCYLQLPPPCHNHRSSRSVIKKVAEKPAELPTRADSANPHPPPVDQPFSLTNGPQPGPAAAEVRASPLVNPALSQSSLQEHSPKSVMRKPWGDKFNFLASLSKDGQYQDLLREINQVFLSDVSLFASSPRYSIKLYFGSVLSTLSQAPTILLGLVGHGLKRGFQRHSTLVVTSQFGSGCRVAHISLTHH
jgi:hypothetical protein